MKYPLGKFNAFWQFVIIGTATFTVVGYFFINFIEPAVKDFVLEQQKLNPVVFANRLAAEFLSPEDFKLPITSEKMGHFERFASHLQVTGLVRLEMWNPDGILVYSDKEDLIGRQFPLDEGLEKALNLNAVAEIRTFDDEDPHHEHGIQFGAGLIVNAPITFGSSREAAGVITIHSRAGFLLQAIDKIRKTIVWRVVLSLAFIFATLSFIVWRASRTVAIQQARLEEYANSLEEARSRLASSIASLPIGFLLVGKNKNILLANPVADKLLGFDSQIRGISGISEALGPDVDFENNLGECLKRGSSFKSGDVAFGSKFLEIFISPVILLEREGRSENRKIIGAVVLIEDATEAKELERKKSEFFTIASHELRTPLSIIRGNMSLAKEFFAKEIGNTALERMIDDSYVSAMRLIQIVNDFLDVSRLELGKMEFKKERVDLAVLARQIQHEFEPAAKEKNLELKIETGVGPFVALADIDRTKQVFANLFSNAINYTQKGGVTVKIQNLGKFMEVLVKDTGVGIAPENQHMLFGKFQQAKKDIYTRDITKGTGLGLYISKGFVEKMGGEIGLVKSTPGEGSVFRFALPSAS